MLVDCQVYNKTGLSVSVASCSACSCLLYVGLIKLPFVTYQHHGNCTSHLMYNCLFGDENTVTDPCKYPEPRQSYAYKVSCI